MRTHTKTAITFLLIGSAIFGGFCITNKQSKEIKTVYLAVAGPMQDESSSGTSFFRAAQLLLEHWNQSAIEKGYRVELIPFDDQNDRKIAKEQAIAIANDDRILGVIGHNYSSTSIAAGEVYKQRKIPAISPTSTVDQVTLNNEWFFRTIFNNSYQGKFLANYAKKALNHNSVIILQEDSPYGSSLATSFEEKARKIGVRLRSTLLIPKEEKNWEERSNAILRELKSFKSNDLLFIASHYPAGIKLIQFIKESGLENRILVPDAFANEEFVKGFDRFSKEVGNPGYYSNDIHVAVPLLYDASNFKALRFFQEYQNRYGVEPDWRAAFAYDAALLFATAIETTNVASQNHSISNKRRAIRDHLRTINHEKFGVKGVTGLNFFDEQGNASTSIIIGQYKNRILVPALTQFQTVADIKNIPNLQNALADELIVPVDDAHMYKTNIVYTGININKISEIDFSSMTCDLDFDLWFRYVGSIDVRDIEFLNSVNPLSLRIPLEEIRVGKTVYRRYHVRGKFRLNFILPSNPDRHIVGVRFTHKSMIRKNLIFVPDKIGGEVNISGKQEILITDSHWEVNQSRFFQDTYFRKILGNINYLHKISKKIAYSQFTAAIELKDNKLKFRNSISVLSVLYFMLFLSVIMSLLFQKKSQFYNRFVIFCHNRFVKGDNRERLFHQRKQDVGFSYFESSESKKTPSQDSIPNRFLISKHMSWFLSSIALLIFLYSIETISITLSFGRINRNDLEGLKLFFGLLWWVASTHIISAAIKEFIWDFIEEKAGHEVPPFLQGFCIFVLYLIMAFGIIAFVFDQKITSIIGTSGIFLMIIGLAVQMNISNIFASLVLNMERSIKVNDWIKIGDLDEGKVMEVNWRTTKIMCRDETVLHIPNNTISDSEIQNFTSPNNVVGLTFHINLDKEVAFEKVQTVVLNVLNSVELVLKSPKPSICFGEYTHWSAKYIIFYYTDDYGKKNKIKREVWEKLLKAMNREKIRSATIPLNFEEEE